DGLGEVTGATLSLDPRSLPGYAARTTLRMLLALVLSLLFTFGYATPAATSRRAEQLLMPVLDILQPVPILGFVSVTVAWFLALAPGRVLGAELATTGGSSLKAISSFAIGQRCSFSPEQRESRYNLLPRDCVTRRYMLPLSASPQTSYVLPRERP